MRIKYIILTFCLVLFVSCKLDEPVVLDDSTITYDCIWNAKPHCAFTDLVEYNGKYYCVFREGDAHVPESAEDYGGIRLLVSEDGVKWEPFELLTDSDYDLRDPKLSLSFDNKLVLIHGCTNKNKINYPKTRIKFFTSEELSNKKIDKGRNYFNMNVENDEIFSNFWIWRIKWYKNKAYGVAYKNGRLPLLVVSDDGINYSIINELNVDGNEADIEFSADGTMHIVIRGQNDNGFIGSSTYPYDTWNWDKLSYLIHCPDVFKIENSLYVVGRGSEGTTIFKLNRNDIHPVAVLPSFGDNAYPGAIIVGDELWISYYSGSPTTAIYLAKVKISEILNLS